MPSYMHSVAAPGQASRAHRQDVSMLSSTFSVFAAEPRGGPRVPRVDSGQLGGSLCNDADRAQGQHALREARARGVEHVDLRRLPRDREGRPGVLFMVLSRFLV